jgi:5'-3' exonuclease
VLLIVDGNNLAWAGYYALERAMKPDTEERRDRVAMLGLASAVLGVIARGGEPPGSQVATGLARVAICFDEGRPLRRRAMYPPYQTGRERDPKFIANEPTILRAIAEFSKVALSLPVSVVRGINTEADDLIAALVHANPRARKRIVSTDRDFLQLVDASTSIYSPVKKVVIDAAGFDDALRPKGCGRMFKREQYLDYRALTGDSSDDLPGIPGVGPATAVAMLVYAPVEAYFATPSKVRAALGRRSDRVESSFADGTARETVERNRTLMNLRLPAPCWDALGELTTDGAWDRATFAAWFEEQRFSGVDGPALFARLEALSTAR